MKINLIYLSKIHMGRIQAPSGYAILNKFALHIIYQWNTRYAMKFTECILESYLRHLSHPITHYIPHTLSLHKILKSFSQKGSICSTTCNQRCLPLYHKEWCTSIPTLWREKKHQKADQSQIAAGIKSPAC